MQRPFLMPKSLAPSPFQSATKSSKGAPSKHSGCLGLLSRYRQLPRRQPNWLGPPGCQLPTKYCSALASAGQNRESKAPSWSASGYKQPSTNTARSLGPSLPQPPTRKSRELSPKPRSRGEAEVSPPIVPPKFSPPPLLVQPPLV